MASALTSTYGIWLVSLFLETILYGCGLLQAWLYFHWYSKDHWGIKAMVITLVIIETLQVAFLFAATYTNLIDNFGNFEALFVILWSDAIQLMAIYLSAFLVQMYFAYCIYILNKKNKFVTLFIVALALTQIGAGIAQTTKSVQLGSFLKLESTKNTTTLQSAATAACDIAITITLVSTLDKHKAAVKSTNNMLNMLIINAVNRGMLTAVCAVINMVLFLALPDTFYFFIGLVLSSKLYMNSALATLNTRQHILKKSSNVLGWQSVQMSTMPTVRGTEVSRTAPVEVTVDSQTFYDPESSVKKQKFIDGMV